MTDTKIKRAVVVLPTYNEKENIEELIPLILSLQEKIQDYELHILVSDSHSIDGTLEAVEKIAAKNNKVHLLDVKERGIGVGLIKGHQYAIEELKADVLVQMDADLQHDPHDIPKFLEGIHEGYDLVIGSRLIKGGENRLPPLRWLFSWGAAMVGRIVMGLWRIHEFTTSYRAFTKDLFLKVPLDKVPWEGQSFLIQPAFLYYAVQVGAKVKEIPIIFGERKRGVTKIRTLNYITDYTVFAFKVRIEKSKTFIKFGIVGFIGFIVNAIVWKLLFPYFPGNISFLIFHFDDSQLIAGEAAIISNFIFNSIWTFKQRNTNNTPEGIFTRFWQFNLTSYGAVLISSWVIGVLKILVDHNSHLWYLAVGVLVGMFWNYIWNSFFIFKNESAQKGKIKL